MGGVNARGARGRPGHLLLCCAVVQRGNHAAMPLKVYVTPVTPFEQNCSVIVCENTRIAAVVDPGGDLHRIRSVNRREILGEIPRMRVIHPVKVIDGRPTDGEP